MRLFALTMTILSLFACKPRDPEAGGLLSEDTPADDGKVHIAKGGDYHVECAPAEADLPLGSPTYLLEVEGAANAGDEAQELLVTVKKSWSGRQDVVASKELGHGAVSEGGPLFVGFTSGVLTGDVSNGQKANAYTGILTLAGDVEGLKVTCQVLRAH